MKYQVLLVDDEKIYLQYLQSMMDWRSMDCVICGCAQDGEDAVRIAEKTKPDIIFMDISMSKMDGLEVCEALRARKNNAKIIIMTAYNEFSFAHRAIKLNVFDYLLKPFDEEELSQTLRKCIQEILKERKLEREQQENILKSLLDSNALGEECSQMRTLLGDHHYVAVLLGNKKMSEKKEELVELLEEYFSGIDVKNYFLGNQDGCGIVVHLMMGKVIPQKEIKRQYQRIVEEHPENEFQWAAIGNVVCGVEKLQETYRCARIVRENRAKLRGEANSYEDVLHLNKEVTFLSNSDTQLLIKAYESKEYDQVDQIIEKMFALSKDQMFSFQYVIATYYSLVTGIYSYYHYSEENNLTDLQGTQTNLVSEIGLCSTTEQMLEIVRNFVYEAFSDCMTVRIGNKKEELAGKIEAYLQRHYSERSLSVNQIAESLFFENSYIRRVFKMQTGKTIMQRLEEIRLEKARELLTQGKYRNSEIAQMTGYCDQYYFSKRFKLFYGCAPSEYLAGILPFSDKNE